EDWRGGQERPISLLPAHPMRPELQSVLDSIAQLSPEEVPALIGELATVQATAQMRLQAPAPAPQHDELLDVEMASPRLGMSKDYLYRHAGEFSFTRRMGRKLLFSSLGIDAYIRQRKAR